MPERFPSLSVGRRHPHVNELQEPSDIIKTSDAIPNIRALFRDPVH